MRLFKNRGLFAACSAEPPQVGPAFESGRTIRPFCPCLELAGRQTITTFPSSQLQILGQQHDCKVYQSQKGSGGSNKAFQSFQLIALQID
jgi:hypothetical protein